MRIPYKGQACYVSSPFGNRILNGKQEYHKGIDLVGLDGDRQLIAPCSGKVAVSTIIDKNSGNLTWQWGNYIRIDTDDGYSVYMCHMASRFVKTGQRVVYGTPVGVQGNTGYSFGEHCHFEVRKNNVSINPAPLLGIENKIGTYKDKQNNSEFAINDQVSFIGNKQYQYSQGIYAIAAQPCDAKITAIYTYGNHPYHIIGNSVYGWVDQQDIISKDFYKVKVIAQKLNIRGGAGVNFPITGTLNKGNVVNIIKITNNWGKLDSNQGWISLSYTEKV